MFTKEKDGIICDQCGAKLANKFDYFSMKSSRVKVDLERKSSEVVQVEKDILDFEVCPNCYKKLTDKVLEIANANPV